jgi:hypothetical protein
MPKLESDDLGRDWSLWLMAQFLLRQAGMLIEEQAAAK